MIFKCCLRFVGLDSFVWDFRKMSSILLLLFIVPLITIIQCQPITTILAHFDFESPVDEQGTFRDSSGNNVQAKLEKLAKIVDNPFPSTIVKANNSVLQVFGSGSRAVIGNDKLF
jgi:hypothetical protein